MNWQEIEAAITNTTGQPFELDSQGHVGGGCINTAMKISGNGQAYFLKLNDGRLLEMFEAEAEGLHALAAAQGVRVPAPICTGLCAGQAYIVMEYLEFGGHSTAAMARFGEGLARMHQYTQAQFGWHRDNTIGSTPQKNCRADDWVEFWREQRLGYQLQLAVKHGIAARIADKGERLQASLAQFFSDYLPRPSVLHGDLWSGNYRVDQAGEAVIFDPAVYFGDREADIAMTELFGGFGREFYVAYNATWPLDSGYIQRKTLYNLYHILNHFNLFGGGYAGQAETMLDSLLAELG